MIIIIINNDDDDDDDDDIICEYHLYARVYPQGPWAQGYAGARASPCVKIPPPVSSPGPARTGTHIGSGAGIDPPAYFALHVCFQQR